MLASEQEIRLLRLKHPEQHGTRTLRVGVVHAGAAPSLWVSGLVSFFREVPGISVELFAAGSSPMRAGWLVDRLYTASRSRFDPFGDLPVDGGAVGPEFLENVRAAGCDLVLWLARRPAGEADLAVEGVLSLRFGERDRGIPWWDEVSVSAPVSKAAVSWHDRSFASGRIVCEAETSTVPGLFVTQNAEQPLAGAIRMLADLAIEIRDSRFAGRVRKIEPVTVQSGEPNYPSTFEAAGFIAKKLARSASLRQKSKGKSAQWFIALRPNRGAGIGEDMQSFRDVAMPPGVGQMADPFLVEAAGRQYLLFEEIASGQGRGRLGYAEVQSDGSCGEMTIFLDRPYHLSYPCVVPSDGELFLLPETFEANRVELYRYRRFPDQLELVAAPLEDASLVDTTPVFVEGRWYFFTTTIEPFVETLLFSSARPEGPWMLHPASPVSRSIRNSRSAGNLFWKGGRLFRPTQDCSLAYGYAMTVNEVTKLTSEEFEERPVAYVPPTWAPGLIGTHTWNESSEWQVVDGNRVIAQA